MRLKNVVLDCIFEKLNFGHACAVDSRGEAVQIWIGDEGSFLRDAYSNQFKQLIGSIRLYAVHFDNLPFKLGHAQLANGSYVR